MLCEVLMMPTVGEKIRALRKAKQMTANELADRAGFTQGYIPQLERGLSGFSPEGLERIAAVFAISPTLLQDPNIEIDLLTDTSEILSALSKLPPEKVALVKNMIFALAEE